ncbi:MAG: hypothetical protein BWX88_02020 [Planctomycetes bacterium ADurb.Bin126]|nr:MAG: hypothetical protein BWX88_02020 [Planctomycetes bacterium ADurb.Bin126]
MLPTSEGLYNAYPVEIGIADTGPNKLATCVIRFRLFEEQQSDGKWRACGDENLEIVGYFYLERKDGSLNPISFSMLKDSLNCSEQDVLRLQEVDLSNHPVQVKLGYHEHNGKTRLKVDFLNPHGSTGGIGVAKGDEPTRKSISDRLAPQLRAEFGSAQVAPKASSKPSIATATSTAVPLKLPPAKPKAPPMSPPPSPQGPEQVQAPAAPQADPKGAMPEEAWDEFCRRCPPGWDQAAVEKEWYRIIADLFPAKQPEQLTPGDWAVMRDQGPGKIIPF